MPKRNCEILKKMLKRYIMPERNFEILKTVNNEI